MRMLWMATPSFLRSKVTEAPALTFISAGSKRLSFMLTAMPPAGVPLGGSAGVGGARGGGGGWGRGRAPAPPGLPVPARRGRPARESPALRGGGHAQQPRQRTRVRDGVTPGVVVEIHVRLIHLPAQAPQTRRPVVEP